jgi:hypothetical protein
MSSDRANCAASKHGHTWLDLDPTLATPIHFIRRQRVLDDQSFPSTVKVKCASAKARTRAQLDSLRTHDIFQSHVNVVGSRSVPQIGQLKTTRNRLEDSIFRQYFFSSTKGFLSQTGAVDHKDIKHLDCAIDQGGRSKALLRVVSELTTRSHGIRLICTICNEPPDIRCASTYNIHTMDVPRAADFKVPNARYRPSSGS